MKIFVFIVTTVLCSFYSKNIQGQKDPSTEQPGKAVSLEQAKEAIISQEKEELKKVVERINKSLSEGAISTVEAEEFKMEAVRKHGRNIENRITTNEGKKKRPLTKRTSTDLVIAFGLNNALQEGQSLDDADFLIAGSRFFEIGLAWTTRVFQHSNWLGFRYGLSFQFNGLKPTDGRYFRKEGQEIFLEPFTMDLEKSKFRMDNLVVPFYFEVGPSKKQEYGDRVWFSTRDRIRIGFGGYTGLNIGQRQKLKFEADGETQKQRIKHDHNTNEIIYGLSAYLGWSGVNLYGKYDLSPIFKAPNPELHNLSLGLRFDVD